MRMAGSCQKSVFFRGGSLRPASLYATAMPSGSRIRSLPLFLLLARASAQATQTTSPTIPAPTPSPTQQPTFPSRPGTASTCAEPLSGEEEGSYEPVCPPGYFRCCSTCKFSTCDGSDPMEISWAGRRECVRCAAGDFCDGCDVFARCPVSEQPGRAGPRVSKIGSTRISDCETCPVGMEASFDRSTCVMRYTDKCKIDQVQRCIRGCESPVPARRKNLDPCEQMKCIMYCTKQDSSECQASYAGYCRFASAPVPPVDSMFDPVTTTFLPGCDVDCNDAPRPARYIASFVAVLALLRAAGLAIA